MTAKTMGECGDLKILGDSSTNGGRFRQVQVLGTLSVLEMLEAKRISVMGTMETEGQILCDELSIMGSAGMKQLTVRERASIKGQLTIDGGNAENAEVIGEVLCAGDFECGKLEVRGAIHVENLLSAETLQIKTKHLCEAKEIGGRSIKVRGTMLRDRPILKAEIIEFDVVDLEHTCADIVRGTTIRIGAGCKIGMVEYRDELNVHPAADIGKTTKL